jgi:hypothetical protein
MIKVKMRGLINVFQIYNSLGKTVKLMILSTKFPSDGECISKEPDTKSAL